MARTYPYGSGVVKLVSTEWLAQKLEGSEIRILDVQPNVHDYIKEHIPGAVYLNEDHFRSFSGGLPAQWISFGAVEPILRSAGLRPDVPVVVYTAVGAFKGWGRRTGTDHGCVQPGKVWPPPSLCPRRRTG